MHSSKKVRPVSFFFLILTHGHFFPLLLEKEEERQKDREIRRETQRERHWCDRETSVGCLIVHYPTGDITCNLDICPDLESNLWPFGLWDNAPTHWARLAKVRPISDTLPAQIKNWDAGRRGLSKCLKNFTGVISTCSWKSFQSGLLQISTFSSYIQPSHFVEEFESVCFLKQSISNPNRSNRRLQKGGKTSCPTPGFEFPWPTFPSLGSCPGEVCHFRSSPRKPFLGWITIFLALIELSFLRNEAKSVTNQEVVNLRPRD